MMYRSENWAVDRKMEESMNVVEIRILRWMNEVSKNDKIIN